VTHRSRWGWFRAVVLSAAVPAWLWAQTPQPPVILRESIQRPAAGGIGFGFTADPVDAKAHRVQVAAGWQTPMVWSLDPTATVTESALGRFQVLIPPPSTTPPLFYRILTEADTAGLLQITEVMSDNAAVFPDAALSLITSVICSSPAVSASVRIR